MKIGVLADTHIPDQRRSLPPRVLEIFVGVEIVLHAGDITSLDVLRRLDEQVAHAFAVYGNSDPASVRSQLQESQVLEFESRRVALVHGHREEGSGISSTLGRVLRRGASERDIVEHLLDRFTDVDAIVFGHTHLPYARTHGSTFLFNPGSPVSRQAAPSVGLLEIDARGIRGRIIPL